MSRPEREHHFPGPGSLDRALRLVRFLRRECPWDARQTAESLVPHLLEETHEVVDAIREGDDEELEGELGDLLLNLAFQIVVAEEAGGLDADSVYARLEAKMIARHPHLFGDGEKRPWEEIKAEERAGKAKRRTADSGSRGVLDGLARGLDPLTGSYRIQQKVAAVGFDWDDHQGPAEKVAEELEEVVAAVERADDDPLGPERADDDRVVEEVGDLLFATVNLARRAGVHPTTALARANAKFRRRFEGLEVLAHERGIELSVAGLEALDELWDEVKRAER